MKNTGSLITVLLILLILGCKCQSDLFDFGGESSSKNNDTDVKLTNSDKSNNSKSTSGSGLDGASPFKTTGDLLPETVGEFKQKERQKKMDDYTVTDYGADEAYSVWYDDGIYAFVSKFKDPASADKALNSFKTKATSGTGTYVAWMVMKDEAVKDRTGKEIGKMVLMIDFGDTAAEKKKAEGTPEPEYILATHNNYLYRIYASKRAGNAQSFYDKLPFE